MIYLFCGQPGAGKTTLASKFAKSIPSSILIDGDKWREVTGNKSYTKESRIENIKSAYNMALYLEKEGFTPVVALVSPYAELRDYLRSKAAKLQVIYLFYAGGRGRDDRWVQDFEYPSREDSLIINTQTLPEEICLAKLSRLFLQG